MYNRIRNSNIERKIITAQQASLLIKDGMTVATSGFTMAGYPKAVPLELANRAENGEKIKITLLTGASVGDELDGALSRSGVISRRYPYQTNDDMRKHINEGNIAYCDLHLSHLPVYIKSKVFGDIDVAIIEAIAIDEDGNIIPTTSVGISNLIAEYAEKVIVEINTSQPIKLEGMHDIYSPRQIPETEPISIVRANNRIGLPYIKCDPNKIAAVVISDIPDATREVQLPDINSEKMAQNIITFLENEVSAKRLPPNLPPLQSGVGAVANAILGGLMSSNFRNLQLYSEVLQDSVLDLIDVGKVTFASATALTISPQRIDSFYRSIERYRQKIILRPQEISNSPEVIRRLGVIAMNTAIEADLCGNINSTHINGTRLMNGIGGSGDFARNASITIFTTASTAKGGTISSIVPYVSHVDHTEHDVDVIVTEQGLADIRGLTAYERAELIIENCAHPDFKDELYRYLEKAKESSKHHHSIPIIS